MKKTTYKYKAKGSSFLETKRWSKIIPSIKNIETTTTSMHALKSIGCFICNRKPI